MEWVSGGGVVRCLLWTRVEEKSLVVVSQRKETAETFARLVTHTHDVLPWVYPLHPPTTTHNTAVAAARNALSSLVPFVLPAAHANTPCLAAALEQGLPSQPSQPSQPSSSSSLSSHHPHPETGYGDLDWAVYDVDLDVFYTPSGMDGRVSWALWEEEEWVGEVEDEAAAMIQAGRVKGADAETLLASLLAREMGGWVDGLEGAGGGEGSGRVAMLGSWVSGKSAWKVRLAETLSLRLAAMEMHASSSGGGEGENDLLPPARLEYVLNEIPKDSVSADVSGWVDFGEVDSLATLSALLLERVLSFTSDPYNHAIGEEAGRAIRENPTYRSLVLAVVKLQSVDLCGASPVEIKVFALNLYHTLALHARIEYGHVLSPSQLLLRPTYNVGGVFLSLYDIEHGILRSHSTPHRLVPPNSYLAQAHALSLSSPILGLDLALQTQIIRGFPPSPLGITVFQVDSLQSQLRGLKLSARRYRP